MISKTEHDQVVASMQSDAYSQAIMYGRAMNSCSKRGRRLTKPESIKLAAWDCSALRNHFRMNGPDSSSNDILLKGTQQW